MKITPEAWKEIGKMGVVFAMLLFALKHQSDQIEAQNVRITALEQGWRKCEELRLEDWKNRNLYSDNEFLKSSLLATLPQKQKLIEEEEI